jgi:hypothetical protein
MSPLGFWLQKIPARKGVAAAALMLCALIPASPAPAQTAWVCGIDSSGLSGGYWAWAHAPAALTAATDKAKAQSAALIVGRRVKLQLAKQADIALAQKKPASQPDAYAGFATLHVGKSGAYRIAANEAADIDVLGGKLSGKPLVKHGPLCSTIAQVAEMKLHSGDIVLQLANAQHPTLDVLAMAVDPDDAGF